MTRQRLLDEINRIRKEKSLRIDEIAYDEFLFRPEYEYLKLEFTKYRLRKEKWHQLVRFALSDKGQHRYMYDRLLSLLLRYRNNYNDYFSLKTETGTSFFPDRISEINVLFSLYKEFFAIFKKVIERIQFDYPPEKSFDISLRGRIIWDGTLRNSYSFFPSRFQLIKWNREFVVPENILLLVAVVWLNRTCKTLLNIPFLEPLNKIELSILNHISYRTTVMVNFFPFPEVKTSASKFYSLPANDKRITDLERTVKLRIRSGAIHSKSYTQLIEWIEKFKQMNIRMISPNRTNFPLDSLENLDTIYEAWIFFEFVNFFSMKGIITKLEIDNEPNFFEFRHMGNTFRFWYEKKFIKGSGNAWAVDSFPDFTVMKDDQIIAIFDAKNYGASRESRGEAAHKILAYITNLDCGYGGLFFPLVDTVEFLYPGVNDSPKFHANLLVGHYNMPPSANEAAVNIKNITLQRVFDEIIRRVSFTTNMPKMSVLQ